MIFEEHNWLRPSEDYNAKDSDSWFKKIIPVLETNPIMLFCTICKQTNKKTYVRINQETFMIHFRDKHHDKLDDAKVAKCPICSMWFNNIKTAQTHLDRNHNDVVLNRTEIKKNWDKIDNYGDKSYSIDLNEIQWTTQRRDAKMPGNYNSPHGLFLVYTTTYTKKTRTG